MLWLSLIGYFRMYLNQSILSQTGIMTIIDTTSVKTFSNCIRCSLVPSYGFFGGNVRINEHIIKFDKLLIC